MIEVGKLPTKELQKLLRCIKRNPKVVVPPTPGFDSGVHKIGEKECLVVSTDPCVGVPQKWFGWLLVHYAASDVSLFGAKPEFCAITLLGPPSTRAHTFIKIMKQVCAAADKLNMTVITGHTGSYDGLSTLIGTCTAYGLVSEDKLITPGGAQVGDRIICTKQIGLETAVNFALTCRNLAETLFGRRRARRLETLVKMQTCVKEASILAEVIGVHAMHDTTEGGLVAALNEMAESSNLGFAVNLEKLSVAGEIQILQEHFNLSQKELLSVSSTGTLLAAADPESEDQALQELRKHHIEANSIGTFTENKERVLCHGQQKTAFPRVAKDPYAKIMRTL